MLRVGELRDAPIAGRLRAMLGRGVLLALVLVAAARPAAAQPDYEAAKKHYQAAEKASAEGRHAQAAREYGIAYDITKDPVLFFKIGNSYDRAGDCTAAKVYYLRYLKEGKPAPEYRQRTEALIAACKNRAPGTAAPPVSGASPASGTPPPATPPASGTPPPATPPASGTPPSATPPGTTPGTPSPGTPAPRAATSLPRPTEEPIAPGPQPDGASLTAAPPYVDQEPPSWQRTAAWTSVGMTFALGTTAAVLALSAGSREEDIQNLIEFRDPEGRPATYTGATADRYRDLVDEGDRLEKLSVMALAATGAAAAASAVFFVLDGMRAEDEEAGATGLAPSVSPGPLRGPRRQTVRLHAWGIWWGGAGLNWTGSF